MASLTKEQEGRLKEAFDTDYDTCKACVEELMQESEDEGYQNGTADAAESDD